MLLLGAFDQVHTRTRQGQIRPTCASGIVPRGVQEALAAYGLDNYLFCSGASCDAAARLSANTGLKLEPLRSSFCRAESCSCMCHFGEW